MFKEVGELYRGSWRFALACPLLFAVPVAVELVQHAAELHIGMYDSVATMKALGDHPLRLGIGIAKSLSLLVAGYWFLRFMGHGEDAARAGAWDARAARLFAPVVLWTLGWTAVTLWGGAPFRLAGVGDGAILAMGVAMFVVVTLIDLYLACWKAGAAVGNPALTFTRSFTLVHGHFGWALGVFALCFLPLMVPHYAIAGLAIGQPAPVLIAMLVADSVLVGFLAVVLAGSSFLVARRATAAAGVPLLPDTREPATIRGALQPA
ncbi:MAG TPA: hypothetical protein VEZ48_03645 [Sphingomonadaceae bacterium]|nr:hypothetical protein [Sphingomonadaceae bacterium]